MASTKAKQTHNARILNVLQKTPSITPTALSKRTGVPLDSVYKRVHELRVEHNAPILSEYRTVKGVRKIYYTYNKVA
jgi:Winged helix-turn-helix DNA-binding